jgi:hypothetical protein
MFTVEKSYLNERGNQRPKFRLNGAIAVNHKNLCYQGGSGALARNSTRGPGY